MSFSFGTGPKKRESCERVRLSPIMNTWPSGTVSGPNERRSFVLRLQVRLLLTPAVQVEDAAPKLHGVALHGDDALYEVVLSTLDALEEHDVAALLLPELVGQLVDEDPVFLERPVTYLQRRGHAPGADVAGVGDDRLHEAEHEDEGGEEGDNEFQRSSKRADPSVALARFVRA